jgi:hypothetical protein
MKINGRRARITDSDKAKLESIAHSLTDYFERIQEARAKGEPDYLLAELLLKNIYSFMLLTEIQTYAR